jgi:hypothetical protein
VDEFGQFCAEGGNRRLMVIKPARAVVRPCFARPSARLVLAWLLREREEVWWARKDGIAQWLLAHPGSASWVDRDLAPSAGFRPR